MNEYRAFDQVTVPADWTSGYQSSTLRPGDIVTVEYDGRGGICAAIRIERDGTPVADVDGTLGEGGALDELLTLGATGGAYMTQWTEPD
jgi:hypothetical protein